MVSQVIPLEKLYNTRDLGGMPGEGGRLIRKGKLIRSGHLYFASPADVRELSGRISMIVDFRNRQESLEKPDPDLGAGYINLPIIQEMVTGVTREEKSFRQITEELIHNPEGAFEYMKQVYQTFVTNEFAMSQYAHFLDLLLEEREGAVLWHCTAGKDRAGFASVIVQELLGVDRGQIMADYMWTNECLKPEVEPLIAMLQEMLQDDSEEARESLEILFGARREFLESLYEIVEKNYGSFAAFAEQKLGVNQEKRRCLQELYLEKREETFI